MGRKRHTPEQIIRLAREAEIAPGTGGSGRVAGHEASGSKGGAASESDRTCY